jgi:hypothetical protein
MPLSSDHNFEDLANSEAFLLMRREKLSLATAPAICGMVSAAGFRGQAPARAMAYCLPTHKPDEPRSVQESATTWRRLTNMLPARSGDSIPTGAPRQELWFDFYRALARRNFIRAVDLAHRLGIDEERTRRIERDALKQFIAEYRNFDAAEELCREYRFSAREFAALTDEILNSSDLESQSTFAMRSGAPAYLSVAEQIRGFARRQIKILSARERRHAEEGRQKRRVAAIKSNLGRLFNFRRSTSGGLAPE